MSAEPSTSNQFLSVTFPPTPNLPLAPSDPLPSPNPRKRASPDNTSGANTSDHSDETERIAEKRRRNTMAARRFRQRKEDKILDLEQQLALMKKERDDLRVHVARLEGENVALKNSK